MERSALLQYKTVYKEGKIRAWKDVQYHSIEGGKDQSMEGCAVPQY
jgi:hypothetical protein